MFTARKHYNLLLDAGRCAGVTILEKASRAPFHDSCRCVQCQSELAYVLDQCGWILLPLLTSTVLADV